MKNLVVNRIFSILRLLFAADLCGMITDGDACPGAIKPVEGIFYFSCAVLTGHAADGERDSIWIMRRIAI